jgi:hypothetical protein
MTITAWRYNICICFNSFNVMRDHFHRINPWLSFWDFFFVKPFSSYCGPNKVGNKYKKGIKAIIHDCLGSQLSTSPIQINKILKSAVADNTNNFNDTNSNSMYHLHYHRTVFQHNEINNTSTVSYYINESHCWWLSSDCSCKGIE